MATAISKTVIHNKLTISGWKNQYSETTDLFRAENEVVFLLNSMIELMNTGPSGKMGLPLSNCGRHDVWAIAWWFRDLSSIGTPYGSSEDMLDRRVWGLLKFRIHATRGSTAPSTAVRRQRHLRCLPPLTPILTRTVTSEVSDEHRLTWERPRPPEQRPGRRIKSTTI